MIHGVWGPLEPFLETLLTDSAASIASIVLSLIQSGLEKEAKGGDGVTREGVELAIQQELSSRIKGLKADIQRALCEQAA